MDHIKFDVNDEDEDCRTMWCGNLSEKVTEELLYELFLQAGPLEKVVIITQANTNFAFATFLHSVSVQYTIRLMEGVKLFGKILKLQPRNNGADAISKKKFNKHLEWNEQLNNAYLREKQKEFYENYQKNFSNYNNLYSNGRYPQTMPMPQKPPLVNLKPQRLLFQNPAASINYTNYNRANSMNQYNNIANYAQFYQKR